MLKLIRVIGLAVILSLTSTVVSASVPFPLFDVTDYSSDNGMVGSSAGLSIDATAFALLTSSTDVIDIADVEFMLQAATGTGPNSSQYESNYGSGQLVIGDSISPLLTANFDLLTLSSFDGLSGTFAADLYNMAGSAVVQSLGRLEGTFFNGSASIFSSSDFSADIIAKVGPSSVVPIPGAAVLLLTGLMAMAGVQVRGRSWQ